MYLVHIMYLHISKRNVMKKRLLIFIQLLWLVPTSYSQLLSTSPLFPKDNDAVTITLDAASGNKGLNNYSNTSDVYVHIGLITSASTSNTDWKYVPFTWATTPATAKATSIGSNKYTYTINNIRTFFNVPGTETIYKIAILFRNGAGSQVQRNEDGSDMFLTVYNTDVAIKFTTPAYQPTYVPVSEKITKAVGENISLTANANKVATLKLYLNGTVVQSASNATSISATPTLSTGGSNTVVAEANDGTITKRDTIKFFVNGGVNTAPLPAGVRDGINYLPGNTSAILVLYAPGKNRVGVIGDFAGSNWAEQTVYQMNKTPDGNYWWLQIDGLTAGTEYAYQYMVDGSLKIADPYAEKILDPWNDKYITAATYPSLKTYPAGQSGIVSVLQTNAPSYTWVNNSFSRPDKRNLFVYELLVRDFAAAHDWKALKDTLGYLKRLGINAIEILPFNEFEGNESWGYNPDFYFAPDKYYGPKNTLKEFIDACHGNGIAVVMDIALNHSFGLSPMVQLYWDGTNNRPATNNPWFNPVAKHPYNVGYDMNHESAATKYFFSRVVEHWLKEYKLDGFRFDLSKGFTQTNSCTSGNCDTGPEVTNWSNYDASRVAIWKGYYDTLQAKSPGSYVILEHLGANNEETILADYGMMLWGNMNYNFNEAAMGWVSTSNLDWGVYSSRGWAKPHLITYMESHDEERLMYKNLNYGNASGSYNVKDTSTALKRNELCTSMFMSIPGPKMIWQFGELGYDFPINYCTDGTTNNNCRLSNKPIRWDYQQQLRRRNLYNVYARMAQLRNHVWYKDVFTANGISITKSLDGAGKSLIVKSPNDTSMLITIGNFDIKEQTVVVNFPKTGKWIDYLKDSIFTASSTSQALILQPGEYHVFLNRNIRNIDTGTVIINPPIDTSSASAFKVMAFPNPYTTATVLQVEVPAAGKGDIVLYDAGGHRVATVFSGTFAKGKQNLTLSPFLAPVAKGVYFLHSQYLENRIVTKIVK